MTRPLSVSAQGHLFAYFLLPIILLVDDKGNREEHYHSALTGLRRRSGRCKMAADQI
jgi:hypothetical protein